MDLPKMALCQLSFPDTSFARDIELAVESGARGISISENKVRPGEEDLLRRELEAARISPVMAIPKLLTILPPIGGMFSPIPADPSERIAQMVTAIGSLAKFEPASYMVCTGPAGDLSSSAARSIVVEGLRTLAKAAQAEGGTLSIEPMRESFRKGRTIVSSLQESIDLIDEVGLDNVGIVFDIWHMWDSPQVHEMLPRAIPLIHAVQIADWRQPTRGPMDRVMAGKGVADIPRFLRELRSNGFDGWYELEIFSDDGRYGAHYEDSLWKMDPRDFAVQQAEAFLDCWRASV